MGQGKKMQFISVVTINDDIASEITLLLGPVVSSNVNDE